MKRFATCLTTFVIGISGCDFAPSARAGSAACMCDNKSIREIVDRAIAEHEAKKAISLPHEVTTLQQAVTALAKRVNYATYFKDLEGGLMFLLEQRDGVQVQADCGFGLPCLLGLADAKEVLGGVELTFNLINPTNVDLTNAKVSVCKVSKWMVDEMKTTFDSDEQDFGSPFHVYDDDRQFHDVLSCSAGKLDARTFDLVRTFRAGQSGQFKILYPGELFEDSKAFGFRFQASHVVSRR